MLDDIPDGRPTSNSNLYIFKDEQDLAFKFERDNFKFDMMAINHRVLNMA